MVYNHNSPLSRGVRSCHRPCTTRRARREGGNETRRMRKNLKEARQRAGMTQKEVAEYLGMTERAYQRIESGERLGIIETWDLLEDLFNIHQRKLREVSSN